MPAELATGESAYFELFGTGAVMARVYVVVAVALLILLGHYWLKRRCLDHSYFITEPAFTLTFTFVLVMILLGLLLLFRALG